MFLTAKSIFYHVLYIWLIDYTDWVSLGVPMEPVHYPVLTVVWVHSPGQGYLMQWGQGGVPIIMGVKR